MNVRVYRNLHKTKTDGSPVYSVQTKQEKGWRLDHHATHVLLKNVTFKVSEAGRQSCLSKGQKVVHAYVCGETVDRIPWESMLLTVGLRATYNPKVAGHFYRRGDDVPVHQCDYAVIGPQGIIIYYQSK